MPEKQGAGRAGQRRNVQRVFAGELVVNLFDAQTQTRYFLVVQNSQKAFYLLEADGDSFKVRGEQSLPHPSPNVTMVTANDNFTKIIVVQDRYLRLYSVNYPHSGSQMANFELLDSF